MDIFTIRDNLVRTIAGKEQMMKGIATDTTYGTIVAQMLDYNITDLQRILADVEQCIDEDSTKVLLCSAV